jgi:short-subunit dehydrogenase
LLINNAGLGDLGPFATADSPKLERMMVVNMNALTLLTRAALPGMIDRRSGGVLNVSSCAGFLPIPGFAIYAATKAYVTSFTEALRIELRGSGVTASALCPGPVHTEFTDVARRPGAAPPVSPEFVHEPMDTVVRAGLKAIEQEKPLVIPGAIMKIGMLLTRITPMPLLRLVSRFNNRASASD